MSRAGASAFTIQCCCIGCCAEFAKSCTECAWPYAPGIERAEVFQMQRAHRERLAEEYARSYMAGWRECFRTCLSAVEEEIARVDDTWDVGSFLPAAPKPPGTEN